MPALAVAGDFPSRLGKYDLLMPLAAGGMARIYIGRTTGIGSFERHVVLKLILPERANDITAVQMFLDEARLAAALNHQNVAQVFEVGQDAGIHYLAMEYVHGQDLRALLAKAGGQGTRLPLELALTVVAGAASGLHHAHERRGPDGVPLGIVHRDVSPSNIMIGYDGSVKLLDFGIAKAAQRSVETQSGIIKGKFAYMAPEQCRGRDVDPRSDVFSLGIILYEVTTQHRCFRADSDFDTMHRIVTGDVVRPTRLVPNYPQALEAIVMKALAVDPAQRYQSAAALLEALESFSIQNRMGLSTNALGKFMREMFGEQVEPWLLPSARASAMLRQSESTISNTSTPVPTPTTGVVGVEDWVPQPQAESARIETRSERPDARHDWSSNSRQSAPLIAVNDARASQPMMLPPPPPGPARTSAPMVAVEPPPGSDPATAFIAPMLTPTPHPQAPFQTPVSGSGQGYAAGQSQPGATAMPRPDPSYAQLEVEGGTPIIRSRMPLVVGACAIVAVAIIVVVAIAMTGTHPEVAATTEPAVHTPTPALAPPAPPAPTPAPAPTITPVPAPIEEPTIKPKPVPAPSPEVALIKVAMTSEPSGADVQLDGKYVGVTPLVVKRRPTTASSVVLVHRKGYQDVTLKIDLSGDVTKSVSLKKLEPDRPPPVAIVRTPPPVRVAPKKPACQPPGQVDPFDSRPVCSK